MKILSIGNSFSQDSHKYLCEIAKLNGVKMYTANLYIGGCSLETHYKNYEQDNEYYDLEICGKEAERKISILGALRMDDWDVVTLQQVSSLSGNFESYEPYLSSLADIVRKEKPNAKLYFHQTWAYETDSTHGDFKNYNNDQKTMYKDIIDASSKAAETIGAELIPTGKIIQNLRENVKEFDYQNEGLSLCRDGFHLSLDYGRFAAAATWFLTLTDKKIKISEFKDFNPVILDKIIKVVNSVLTLK